MKKMKDIAAAPAASDQYVAVYEDPRVRLKHQILMQDFEELQKETMTMRKKLRIVNRKKQTLMAEVRFLRQRYGYLMRSRFLRPAEPAQTKSLQGRSKPSTKAKKPPPVPRFNSNQKKKASNRKELPGSPPLLDLNQSHKIKAANAATRTCSAIPDLNRAERTFSGVAESTITSKIPAFDLNQISREEEELETNANESLMGMESKILRNLNDEAEMDVKLSTACRNSGKGSGLVGKRKISWQDPVALRA